MARIEKTVFISYRRTDVYTALAVYQDLSSKGYDVFFDYTSISSGDFEQIIISNIKARAHFLLILTPTALDRVNEPGDWLRREIETAIDEQRNIIPLFFKGFNFGASSVAEKLIGKLSTLPRYNGMNVHEDYFRAAMDRLSEHFLDVPLNAILHPLSTEVRKAVRKEQNAVNEALVEKWEDLKKFFKLGDSKTIQSESHITGETTAPVSTSRKPVSSNARWFAIGFGVLLLTTLSWAGIKLFSNGGNNSVPTMTNPVVVETSTVQLSSTVPVNTLTPESPTFTSTEEPTLTVTLAPTLGVMSTEVSPKDGMILMYVPAGEFRMGIEGEEGDEKPIHTVYLDAYWIDQTEVTNAMYAKCVRDGSCNRPASFSSSASKDYYGNADFDEYPVIFVSWDDAQSYCAWADRRLPTEAEWEKAARGKDQRNYPWGERIDCLHANYFNGRYCFNTKLGGPSPVKKYELGKSPYGLYDMAGNVWEWVADWYGQNYYASLATPISNPLGPVKGTLRVARGGSWADTDFLARTTNRGSFNGIGKSNNTGFRCARSATP